jgi:hypothetical protein
LIGLGVLCTPGDSGALPAGLASPVGTRRFTTAGPGLPFTHPIGESPGDRWFVDETYVKVAGRWIYLYRAIDQFGQVIDVLVSEKRNLAATRWFFTRALEYGLGSSEVTTDRGTDIPTSAR